MQIDEKKFNYNGRKLALQANFSVELVFRSFGGGRDTLSVDGDNKQTEIKNGTTLLAKYSYDGEGKRVKKIVYNANGVTIKEETVFVYDALRKLIAEYSTNPPPTNPTTSYTATDQLGSPRVITNSQGEVVSRRDFQPFGEELTPDGTNRTANLKYNLGDGIRQKFTGYQKDEETNLDFAEARMYENRHARFTAVDPLLASGKSANPQTFNRYVYVMNSPLKYSDPTGLQAGNHRGTVYYRDLGNGQYALASYKKTGYTEYMKGKVSITGTDGYKYTLFRGGWTQGRKVAASQVYFGNSEGAAKSTPYVNKELIESLAENGQRKFNTAAAVVGGGGVGGGILAAGCVALCGPAVAIAGSAGASALGSPVTQGIIAGLAGGGIGMVVAPSGSSGGGLPPELSRQLGDIYSTYPKTSFDCDCAAQDTLNAFKYAGMDGQIVEFQDKFGADILMDSEGNRIAESGYHQTVRVGDMYYDALTGPGGATQEEYFRLFYGDAEEYLQEVVPRPFTPRQP